MKGSFALFCIFFPVQAGVPLTTFFYAISNESSFGGKGHFSFTYLQRCSCFWNEWFNKEMRWQQREKWIRPTKYTHKTKTIQKWGNWKKKLSKSKPLWMLWVELRVSQSEFYCSWKKSLQKMERCIEMKGRGGDFFFFAQFQKKPKCVCVWRKKKEEKKERNGPK